MAPTKVAPAKEAWNEAPLAPAVQTATRMSGAAAKGMEMATGMVTSSAGKVMAPLVVGADKMVEATVLAPEGQAFLRMPQDLGGLTVSGWLVPTVKGPFRAIGLFCMAICMQITFMFYMFDALLASDSSACSTPALLQVVAVFVFGANVFSGFTAHKAMQIALYSTHLKAETDTQYLVRKTDSKMRKFLFALTLTDLLVEGSVFFLGCYFLVNSSSVNDVVLNSVAVNFIAEIDEALLGAFIVQSAKSRLEKYRFNVPVGIEEGDTKMKGANQKTLAMSKLSKIVPYIWFLITFLIVGIFQSRELGKPGQQCSILSAQRSTPEAVL